MQKALRRGLSILVTLALCTSLLPMGDADARGGGGGRGGGGRSAGASRGGGGSRGGGASPRVNTGVSTQNRGNFNSRSQPYQSQRQSIDRSQYQQNRQTSSAERQGERTQRQGERQSTQQTRQTERTDQRTQGQTERTERQGERQEQRTQRQGERQEQTTNRQENRQDFIDDNYNDRWYGGGWYGGGYYVPPGWGLVGLTTGLVIGAAIAQAPPYYDTIYVGSTTYIYSDGVYLQPSGSTYTVVAPPPGAVVNYLPGGCTAVVMNGVQYQNCSGIYYEPVFQNGATAYRVVQL